MILNGLISATFIVWATAYSLVKNKKFKANLVLFVGVITKMWDFLIGFFFGAAVGWAVCYVLRKRL